MTQWHQLSVAQLSQNLQSGKVSSVTLTEHFLTRIEKFNPELNAFITVTPDVALKQAQEADKLLAQGEASPLTGVPYAHKDIFCTQDILTTCGSKMLANFVAPYNATVTEKLADAGMVMLGKTNMDEFAMGSSNEHSYFGACKNPFDFNRAPGGSSGGSACAVAAGLAPCATGTDTGGSIRQPAGFCHLVGLKPTYGRVSRYGMIAFASSLDQGGPMTQHVMDAALMLEAMSGYDVKDSTSANIVVPPFAQETTYTPSGLKVGVIQSFVEALDATAKKEFEKQVFQIQALGHHIEYIDVPLLDLAIPAYYVIAPAEASSNLARYDGVRFGYRSNEGKTLKDMYMKSRSEGFGAEVKRRILAGTYLLSAGHYDAYYNQAQKLRARITNSFQSFFASFDVLMTPTTLSEPFLLGSHANDPVAMYYSDLCTVSVNLAGLPSISLPMMSYQGLPFGVQFIAPHFEESRLLQLGHQIELAHPWNAGFSSIKLKEVV